LLHATASAAQALGIEVVALHVHHGLVDAADRWVAHGRALCARWARRGLPVTFAMTRLADRPGRGDSVEAWARQARYRALRQMALERGIDLVLLAHHRRDQAETFLLQALRGGGVAGLAAMPAQVRREGITWARPWLAHPRAAIDAYVSRHRLSHVDDQSNADARFARNRLRLEVWPALVTAFPDAEASLATAAGRAQQAADALAEAAESDLAALCLDGRDLDIAAWRALSPARQGNVLRAWLRRATGRAAPTTLVDRLLRELPLQGSRRWPTGDGELRSYRGRLRFEAATPAGEGSAGPRPGGADALPTLDFRRPGMHELPGWAGSIEVRAVRAGGIALSTAAALQVRERRPGDRFQAGVGRPPRSLKLQFQAAGLPAWQRGGPLLVRDGVPVFVGGLGIDARALASPGEPQLSLAWRPRR
jgi:tRNA(Ile)-lysidine synthase